MKNILSILAMVLCSLNISAQEQNLKGFWHAFELMCDTTAKSFEENIKYQEYLDKNVKPLDMEVFQVLEDTDSVSYCLVKIFKDSKYDYNVAYLETVDEVVFEGKVFEQERCFLAGTYTYLTRGDEKKTVPYYMTLDAFISKLTNILHDISGVLNKQPQ